MSDIKLSECLFVDLKTDAQRRDWFLLGRGVETGIIAPALQAHLVNAYSKIVESGKLIEQLQQQIAELEQREAELSATVEWLRELFVEGFSSGDDHDLDAWEEKAKSVLESTPQQNLNAVKREVAIEAFQKGAEWWAQCELDDTLYLDEHQTSIYYANTKYPNDKDNE